MALSPTSSRGSSGSSLPSQWTASSKGALTIHSTGASGDNDYETLLDIYNSDNHNVFSLDSSGEASVYIQTALGVSSLGASPRFGSGISLAASDIVLAAYNDAALGGAWWINGLGLEVMATRAAPSSGDLVAAQLSAYYDSTNGAARHVRVGKTANGTVVQAITPLAPPITSGALPTATLTSATGAQIALNRDARTVTPVTFNPTGAATATCLVQISPDNVTYSTLVTKTFPVSVTLAGSIDEVSVIVPAGWYLKLTTTNATLGTTTYY